MSAWGGFKRRVHGVLAGWALSSLGLVVVGVGQVVPVWVVGTAYTALWIALINGSNQAIWQSKVAPDVQGRVFSARRLIAWFSNPISPLIAGTMADFVLEPAMKSGGRAGAGLWRNIRHGAGSRYGAADRRLRRARVDGRCERLLHLGNPQCRDAPTRLRRPPRRVCCAGRGRQRRLIDLVGHVSHDHARDEEQREAEECGGLCVEQVVEPPLGHELRHDDRDDLVRLRREARAGGCSAAAARA